MYDLTATWFFRPRVAVQFGLSRMSSDSPIANVDRAAVRFIGRL
jgi:hypothetical protein